LREERQGQAGLRGELGNLGSGEVVCWGGWSGEDVGLGWVVVVRRGSRGGR